MQRHTPLTGPSAQDLESEFDPRLADVWLALFGSGLRVDEEAKLAVILRMAYLRGYEDALVEPERGEMFARLGIPVPKRQTPRASNRKGASR